MFCVRAEQSVRVQCLKCGHVGLLTVEVLSRRAITPSTPIVAFVKRLAAAAAAVKVCWRRARLHPDRKRPPDLLILKGEDDW